LKLFQLLEQWRKNLLVQKQQAEDREGEIWIKSNCRYVGGKDARSLPIVRTKYCQEIELVITKLTPTTAEGRLFGAIEVAKEVDGKLVPIGSVGAGFALSDMLKLSVAMMQILAKLKSKCGRGLTESGQLWHGRFLEFCC
jgi:bifunctional non-homologous end joining protein LigD